MKKKTSRKSGSVKSVRNLPAKSVKAKTAAGVKGGSFARVHIEYKPQKDDGSISEK